MKNKRKFIFIAIILFVFLAAFLILDVGSWEKLDMDKLNKIAQASIIYDADGREIEMASGKENRTSISIDQIPIDTRNAFIAAEDARFYSHIGIDPWRIGGALISNIKSGGYSQGASTITQQLIKLTHLSSEKTLARKANEAFLALQLERVLDKDEILEKYLNTVYFGAGAYGIQAAARTYFGIDANALTLDQGALLAGVIKSPSNYAPHLHPENAIERRKTVLDAMVENGFITAGQAQEAASQPLNIVNMDDGRQQFGWYTDQVLSDAEQLLGLNADELLSGGYRIYTALDVQAQENAQALFDAPENFPAQAEDGEQPQAALVALDPQNGEVICLIGGRAYSVQRGLNRATQIARQPGSALKPISVYAAAVDQYGYLPTSMIEDTQRDFGGGYTPRNAGDNYYGTVTLREALSRSLNVASVDLLSRMDIASVRRYIQKSGIELDKRDSNLSLALGSMTYGVSPMTLCAAYAPLSNGGNSVTPHLIRRIEDSSGKTVYQFKEQNSVQVLRPQSAYMITSMLMSAADWGSAHRLGELDFEVAGKTGTVAMQTGGNRDVWTVAYTPTVATAVWMGFDNPDLEHCLSDSVSGSSQPAALAEKFLNSIASRASGGSFAMPDGLTEVLLDKQALNTLNKPMLASENTPRSQLIKEIFPSEKEPTEVSDVWKEPARVFDLTAAWDGDWVTLRFTALEENALYRLYRALGDSVDLVAELYGLPGDYLTWTDTQYQTGSEYYVIAVNRPLLEEGITLEGKASQSAVPPQRTSPFDWLFGEGTREAEATPAPVPQEQPLFDVPLAVSTPSPSVTADAEGDLTASPAPSATPTPAQTEEAQITNEAQSLF